jgi:hypothetical protein
MPTQKNLQGITLNGEPLTLGRHVDSEDQQTHKMDPDTREVYSEEVGKRPRSHVTTKNYTDREQKRAEVKQWPKDLIELENAYAEYHRALTRALHEETLSFREIMLGFMCTPEFRNVRKLAAMCNEVTPVSKHMAPPSARALAAELSLPHRGKLASAFVETKVINGIMHYKVTLEAIKAFSFNELKSMTWKRCVFTYMDILKRSPKLAERLVEKRHLYSDEMLGKWQVPAPDKDVPEPVPVPALEVEEVEPGTETGTDPVSFNVNIDMTIKVDGDNMGALMENIGALLHSVRH